MGTVCLENRNPGRGLGGAPLPHRSPLPAPPGFLRPTPRRGGGHGGVRGGGGALRLVSPPRPGPRARPASALCGAAPFLRPGLPGGAAGEGLSCRRGRRVRGEGEPRWRRRSRRCTARLREGGAGRGRPRRGGGAAGRWASAPRAGGSRSEAGGRERKVVVPAGPGAGSQRRVPRVSERAQAGRRAGEGAVPRAPKAAQAGRGGGWVGSLPGRRQTRRAGAL